MQVSSAHAQDQLRARRRISALRRLSHKRQVGSPLATGLIAVAVFALAYVGGGYGAATRTAAGVLVWAAVAVGLLLGRGSSHGIPRAAAVVGGLLLAFAVLTLASTTWGASAEAAFAEFTRVLLYVGIFAAAVLAARRAHLDRWLDGIALAVVAVAAVSLASRFFPSLFEDRELPTFLPTAQARLSFPVDYWNGLAVLAALVLPLLLRNAAERARHVAIASVGGIPIILTAIYLTSSRAGALAAALGSVAFVALTDRRWRAAGALAVGGLASVGVVAFLSTRDALVNGPFESGQAAAEGGAATVVLLVTAVAAAAVWAFVPQWVARHVTLPRQAGYAVAAVLGLAFAAAAVAANPAERLREFTETPPAFERNDFVQSHLLSASGNWRWQYWQASIDQFRDSPFTGGGAGTFEAWWAQHGTTVAFIENPHSLYFQVLGELGLPGLLLVLGVVLAGLSTGVLRALRSSVRGPAAAVTGAFAAFALAAGLDWMWQLTVVTAVAMLLLGLVTGVATAPDAGRGPWQPGLRPALVLVAAVVIAVQLDAWVADERLRASRAAAARGDRAGALDAAGAARKLQPWAASPYTQLALLEEEAERLGLARRRIVEALDRDRRDWRLWLIAARIDTRAGDIERARRELDHAERLNPRSPLFTETGA